MLIKVACIFPKWLYFCNKTPLCPPTVATVMLRHSDGNKNLIITTLHLVTMLRLLPNKSFVDPPIIEHHSISVYILFK